MALRRRNTGEGLNPWPGYVDALSTLLMVIIFVLLVFVLGQAFLSVALTGRDRALDRVNRQMAELTDLLSLERGRSQELRLGMAQINRDLQAATTARDLLAQQLTSLRQDQTRTAAERDSLRSDRDRLAARLADADVQARAAQSRLDQLQAQAAEAARRGDTTAQQSADTAAALIETRRQLTARTAELEALRQTATARTADLDAAQRELAARATSLDAATRELAARAAALDATRRDLAAAQAQLTAAQSRIEELRLQAEALDRTVTADRATIEARLSDIARLAEQTRTLTALRDELEKQAGEAAARATTEAQQRAAIAAQLTDERRLGETARAQIALLNAQMDELRAQLGAIARTLEQSEASTRDKDVQIANLGSRLNAALAQKVEELQQYRSEFFGRLREVLAGRPGIQVVGDRFVFQSEVLFPAGSADLSQNGMEQMFRLAETLRDITREIPREVNWVLRVDGHADRQPVLSTRFPSNWELSAQRAITVVKLLSIAGVPPDRLAATAFGDNQPLDTNDSPDAYARNRRIELRLTDR